MFSRNSAASSYRSYVSSKNVPSKKGENDKLSQFETDGSPIDPIEYLSQSLDTSSGSDIPAVGRITYILVTVVIVLVIACLCMLIYLVIDIFRLHTEVDLRSIQRGKPGKPDGNNDTDMTGKPDVTGKSDVTGKPDVTGNPDVTGKPDGICKPGVINWCDTRDHTDEQLRCLPTTCPPSNTFNPRQMAFLESIPVVCDTETDGGNWVIIQRRGSHKVIFTQVWSKYSQGFGNLCPTGSFWLGLHKVHHLCGSVQDQCEIRFDMEFYGKPLEVPKRDDNKYFATYDSFYIEDEWDHYRISLGGYNGTAGDGLVNNGLSTMNINNVKFSTYDNDNDNCSCNCADIRGSTGWWYNSCLRSNLNGQWGGKAGEGIHWWQLTGYHDFVSFSEIKIRRH